MMMMILMIIIIMIIMISVISNNLKLGGGGVNMQNAPINIKKHEKKGKKLH